ncbi:MAG: T9SS type A sorting domain-containing protein [Ignavibacteriae bacterium]|nr:T9SS type A sorting domain-containing protein [Ignavibacteriota bacterium]
MRKVLIFSLALALTFSVLSFTSQSSEPVVNNVKIRFIATNGYGNNLYVDNLIVGSQFQYDVTITSLNNIPKDTNYSYAGTSNFKVAPKITVTNIGSAVASGFNVVMQVGAYTSTKPAGTINSGESAEVTFDSLAISPNTGLNIKTYSTWVQDQNKGNDSLSQYTFFLPGAHRRVLIEGFTQWNCTPCASNTPFLDAFILENWDSVCAIKYHASWPGANNDPMYLANPSQCANRIRYYSVIGVPDGDVDGTYLHIFPYSPPEIAFGIPYRTRMNKGTPIGISVTDTRIAGDSIKASVSLSVLSPVPAGNYRLRINAVERTRNYTGGTNGETTFRDIFRRMYPDSNGIAIPTTVGNYNYEYKYKRETGWIDSLIYTVVFVQNDVTKEVFNSDKGRRYSADNPVKTELANLKNNCKPDQRPESFPSSLRTVTVKGASTDEVTGAVNYEMFEGGFPPDGWTITNFDAGITWVSYNGANGPLLGGSKSALIPFYSYSATGQIDYLTSKTFNDVDLSDSLKFNWAHAVFSGSTDRMQVKISTDGGTTYPFTIFDKSGAALATAPSTTNSFVPSGASQWGTFKARFGDLVIAVQQIGSETPESFMLKQNYPNPFNPVTNITYALPKSSRVTLAVYDVLGNLVETLFEGNQNTGIYITQFDGSMLASGIYFYKLETESFRDVKRMILVK